MSERPDIVLSQIGAPSPNPAIARGNGLRPAIRVSRPAAEVETEAPQIVPSLHMDAPQGMRATLDSALGAVRLPSLLDLAAALDQAETAMRRPGALAPEISDLVADVLADEQRKVLRYLELRER